MQAGRTSSGKLMNRLARGARSAHRRDAARRHHPGRHPAGRRNRSLTTWITPWAWRPAAGGSAAVAAPGSRCLIVPSRPARPRAAGPTCRARRHACEIPQGWSGVEVVATMASGVGSDHRLAPRWPGCPWLAGLRATQPAGGGPPAASRPAGSHPPAFLSASRRRRWATASRHIIRTPRPRQQQRRRGDLLRPAQPPGQDRRLHLRLPLARGRGSNPSRSAPARWRSPGCPRRRLPGQAPGESDDAGLGVQ